MSFASAGGYVRNLAVTVTWESTGVGVVGTPVIAPVAASRTSPAGSTPDVTANVTPGSPGGRTVGTSFTGDPTSAVTESCA